MSACCNSIVRAHTLASKHTHTDTLPSSLFYSFFLCLLRNFLLIHTFHNPSQNILCVHTHTPMTTHIHLPTLTLTRASKHIYIHSLFLSLFSFFLCLLLTHLLTYTPSTTYFKSAHTHPPTHTHTYTHTHTHTMAQILLSLSRVIHIFTLSGKVLLP